MGVPALFRWLSQKYPKIVSPVYEERPQIVDGEEIPVDTTKPNPNGEEFDNLYLDMNGIVHPCSHPEDKPAPSTEAEMMLEVFKYTERVVNMARPRKILMIAVDGVAPRAKMNQQRSRRFRSNKEAKEKDEEKAEFIKLMKQQNDGVLPDTMLEEMHKKTWDSNAITPGTPFMDILALSLRYWTAYKLNTDPAWEKLKIIISDATVPGEGEHKIMNFVRSQRSSPEHDPNTRHVIYGLDADLIMLGLATHEPHFRVLREDVFYDQGKARTCKICGQSGHRAEECRGEAKKKGGEFDEKGQMVTLKPFIWLNVSILREYLAVEMDCRAPGVQYDLERALDDWVFMCFFVGNDFLPHLPSLDIREQGIDTLLAVWRDNFPLMGGYVTKDGTLDLEKLQYILDGLAKQEDAIFKRRRAEEERRDANAKRRKLNDLNRQTPGKRGGDSAPLTSDSFQLTSLDSIRDQTQAYRNRNLPGGENGTNGLTHDMIVSGNAVQKANDANKSAAAVLKERLKAGQSAAGKAVAETSDTNPVELEPAQTPDSAGGKRKRELMVDDADSGTPGRDSPAPLGKPIVSDPDEPAPDDVRLWEEGYGDRYYETKFHVAPEDKEFRHKVARAYVEGLAWALHYYFQGVPSWTWYYPYHYAPFAADFVGIGDMKIEFEKGTPFRPFEQLMGVMPAGSNHTIPPIFHELMTSEKSEIVDFYPEDFEVDLNGKKFAWQGVALLPFIDEKRLLKAMHKKYPKLTEDETRRNSFGRDALLFSDRHPLYDSIVSNYYSKKKGVDKLSLVPRISEGLAGKVEKNDDFLPQSSVTFPLPEGGMPDIDEDHSMAVHYDMPQLMHVHKSMLLRGVQFAPPALNSADIQGTKNRSNKSGRSHGGVPFEGGDRSFRGGRGGYGGNDYGRGQNQYNNGHQNNYGGNQNNYNGGQNNFGDQSRANPFAAHLNPAFFANGMPAPGWVPPPPHMAALQGGMPPMPMGPLPGLNGFPPPPAWNVPPANGGYGNQGHQGYNQGNNVSGNGGGYQGGYNGHQRRY